MLKFSLFPYNPYVEDTLPALEGKEHSYHREEKLRLR